MSKQQKLVQLKKRRALAALAVVATVMQLMFVLAPSDEPAVVMQVPELPTLQVGEQVSEQVGELARFLPGAFR